MRRILCFLFLGFAISLALRAQDTIQVKHEALKSYFFVMLTKGSVRDQDSITVRKIQEGHMANIKRLAAEGKLVVAGPFLDDGNWLGLFIFDSKTKNEVEQLLQTDPAVSSGRLAYEIHPWMTQKGTCFK